jgi:thiamine pyrophosphokinase
MVVDRVHICTGGELDVIPEAAENDLLIGVDGGAVALLDAGLTPKLAIGDFDTIGEAGVVRLAEAGVEIAQFPAEKDATDTEIALETALRFGPKEIVLYGALGTRMDHTLANLHLLWKAHRSGVWTSIESGQNRIVLLSETFPSHTVERDRFDYVSLLPLSQRVTGVTLTGFVYPLHDAVLEMGSSLGVSNQLTGARGTVTIDGGALLVISSTDLALEV